MRKMNSFTKQLKIALIAFSLLPLQVLAECVHFGGAGLEQMAIGQLNASVNSVTGALGSQDEIISSCITNDFEDAFTTDNKLRDVVLVPKNYANACDCLSGVLPKRSIFETHTLNQRMKELKFRHLRLNAYVLTVQELRSSLRAYHSVNPDGELPRECSGILGKALDFPGPRSCLNDLSKVINTQSKLEPVIFNQETGAKSGDFMPSKGFAKIQEEIRFMNRVYANFNRDLVGPRPARHEADQLVNFLFGGIDQDIMDNSRRRGRDRIAEMAQTLGSLGVNVNDRSAFVPFSANEVDAKAIELLEGMISESDVIINRTIANVDSERCQAPNEDRFVPATRSKDKIAQNVAIFECSSNEFGLPRDPYIPPLAAGQSFVPKNEFEEAVLARYKIMANVLNSTRSYMDYLDEIFELEADGENLKVRPDLGETLLKITNQGFEEAQSGVDLATSCRNAAEVREFVCEDIAPEEISKIPLTAKDISLYAAVDLERGDEAKYGQIVCAPFIENNPTGINYFFSNSQGLWNDYYESECDYSQPVQAGSRGFAWMMGYLGTASTCKSAEMDVASVALPHAIKLSNNTNEVRAMAGLVSGVGRLASESATQSELFAPMSGKSQVTVGAKSPFLVNSLRVPFAANESQASSDWLYGDDTPATTSLFSERDSKADFKQATVTEPSKSELYNSIISASGPVLGEGDGSSIYTGSLDADSVSENSFSPSKLFGNSIADSNRYYDSTFSLPENIFRPEEASKTQPEMSESEYVATQRALSASNPQYDSLVKMYEDLQTQLEDLKSEKLSEENEELIAELKAQVADLKKTREDLEGRIESEKQERTKVIAEKELPAARVAQSNIRRGDDYRPAAQPTYSAGASLPATSGAPQSISAAPGVVPGAVSGSGAIAAAESAKREVAARGASELASGSLNTNSGTRSAAMAVGSLRLTSQAFDKLSSVDLKSLYESNNGEPIFVEKMVADGSGSQRLVVEKYVPELIEGEVVYINSGVSDGGVLAQVEEEEVAQESFNPGREIASIGAAEMAEDTMRQVKELRDYNNSLYSPIHQELISKIQAAIAEQRE